ncbi:MAG: DUF1501 domain-containing protein [Acidobacteria bacterium]|nr:DUF1501 domain-containing protein [Acidobacteriota bacterium]
MKNQADFDRFIQRHPHPHRAIFEKPHLSRRRFFELAGAAVTGSWLAQPARAGDTVRELDVTTRDTARQVIFILLAGAPSHIDTFDLKMVNGVTPSRVNPATIGGLEWPTGILPKLAERLPDIAVIRSMRSWALVHSLAQQWSQIGRNPAAALGDIAPNIGSIVAAEKADPSKIFPPFLALNSAGAVGSGYLPATHAPFRLSPGATGLPDTTNVHGQSRFETMYSRLRALDAPLREKSPLGKDVEDYDKFYQSAKGLMYSPVVDTAFRFTPAESARYGNSGFGNACLVARQVLAANQGTRFIQITLGGWDMHNDIYGAQNPNGSNIFTLGRTFDNGLATLLGDLKSSGLLSETLVVVAGEFGRTVGPLSGAAGRDHFLQQFCAVAGAGVKGGRSIGSTNASGSATATHGWSRNRDVRPEDIEATIYSALGINWTKIRYDDPLGRGFEYVPYAADDLYGPVNELWT